MSSDHSTVPRWLWIPSALVSCGYYLLHRDIVNCLCIFTFGVIGGAIKIALVRRNIRKQIYQPYNEHKPAVMTSLILSSTAASVLHLSHYYNKVISAPFICAFAIAIGFLGACFVAYINAIMRRKYKLQFSDALPYDFGYIISNVIGYFIASAITISYYDYQR
eukprot:148475_1